VNTDELRAAAEYVLKVHEPRLTKKHMHAKTDEAVAILARHVQRMYDDTPVDEVWLLSVGASRQFHSLPIDAVELKFSSLPVAVWILPEAVWMYLEGKGIKENPTRGDVRRLCEALGIELREGE